MCLLTDLYELTMADSYFRRGKNEETTFDLFVRSMPEHRNFLVCAGIEQILFYLENLRFTEQAIDYLKSLSIFSEGFLNFLKDFRFTGSVYAIPEGEIYFPREPVVRITAPRIEAQIVETFLLNTFNFQSAIASKAARVIIAAQGRGVVDFSARRDHGADAALKVARASFIAGCIGTSCTLAGMLYGIPVYGTMAHSYVMSFPTELDAFRAFVEDFPNNSILLIDTYDTIQGARHAVIVAKEMEQKGRRLKGVRLDSGDIVKLSKQVRQILDEAGLGYVKIFASGDLNEYKIKALLEQGAPIDFFGVGTEMGVSKDAPALGGVYKLSEDDRGPRIKLSSGKVTLPGKKQVYRVVENGRMKKDIITLETEKPEEKNVYPLLIKVMEKGKICSELPDLKAIRDRFLERLNMLPDELKAITEEKEYPVELGRELSALTEKLIQEYRRIEMST
ncbi:MAG: nicotinate phosphoribosyltransferase [Deferribacteres bacterium]|nr:nicotinate phosphoribosyltransferase [Deferribacteres bacterium]